MENPEKFLKGKYWPSEEFREATEQTAKRTEIREGEAVPNEPEARIENYLKRFTDIFEREDERKKKRGIEALKHLLHKKYIVKPENISEDYIKGVLFGNFAERKGYNRTQQRDPDIKQGLLEQFKAEYGHDFEEYTIPEEEQEGMRNMAVKDQESRLDSWFSYITSPEAENVPAAYRYWAFAEMLKLGSYDDDRKTYNKRTESTAANFPDRDQQALAMVLDEIRKKQQGETSAFILPDEKSQLEFKKRLETENFGKLYAFVQEHLKTLRFPEERLIITEGEWRTFPKGSDAKEVSQALEGFHTQWCIAGEGTAEGYLSHADLHIYFSKDADNKNTIPRACIVNSEKGGITEVRGIINDEDAKQHLDDYITPKVEDRLKDIPGGEKWSGEIKDMKRLASIHIKHRQREELSKEDLRFVYEIDGKIQTTGYGKDSRIPKILKVRDIKGDLSSILGLSREEISTTTTEALKGDIKYHYGDLDLSNLQTLPEGFRFPESVGGYINLSHLQTLPEGFRFPESVRGDIYLSSLQTLPKGVRFPESVGGYIDLSSLQTLPEGFRFPESVGGDIDLSSLPESTKAELRRKHPNLEII